MDGCVLCSAGLLDVVSKNTERDSPEVFKTRRKWRVKVRYWIGVASSSHVERGRDGGFAQLCHGKAAPLRRMNVGDWLVYYSPKTDISLWKPLQLFTAIGRVIGENVYQYSMTPDFIPFRRNIEYLECRPIPIHGLLAKLSFIRDPGHWGYPFRTGHVEITEEDFRLIAKAMEAQVDE